MNVSDLEIQKEVDLAALTTIGLGGKAAYFLEVSSREELTAGLAWAKAEGLPTYILGGGSNTIFLDSGFSGLVLKVGLLGIEWGEEVDGVIEVRAAAGEEWDALVVQTIEKGLGGLECLSGIPGLVGATPMQNVGAYGQEVAAVIRSVTVWDREESKEVVFSNEECAFSYRQSRFKGREAGRYVILEVTFGLRSDGVPTVRYPQVVEQVREMYGADELGVGAEALGKTREAVLALRRSKSMVVDVNDPNSKSCGSFFTNPIVSEEKARKLVETFGEKAGGFAGPGGVKLSAAFLVEAAGFRKGYTYKGVGISANHSLALINRGGTTGELLELQEKIQEAVQEKLGVELMREPVVAH